VEPGHGTLRDPKMQGMFADVFHSIQAIMNFTYDLSTPADGEWGALVANSTDLWTGMIGQLQRKDIDIGER
jgi:hypothetical protein